MSAGSLTRDMIGPRRTQRASGGSAASPAAQRSFSDCGMAAPLEEGGQWLARLRNHEAGLMKVIPRL